MKNLLTRIEIQNPMPMNPISQLTKIWLSFLVFGLMTVHSFAQPTFTVTFMEDEIGPGGASLMTFEIGNPGVTPADQIAFTNNLPAGVSIVVPNSATTTCGANAVLSAPGGGTIISLTDGKLAPGGSCTVSVYVTSSAMPMAGSPVTHTNTSGMLTSSIGQAGPATDDLVVTAEQPGITKSFSPSTLNLGETSTLTITIDNTANPSGVSTLRLLDNFPTGLTIASPSNASTTCGNALIPPTLTATSGTSSIDFFANGIVPTFPSLAAGASCTITVDVVPSQFGTFENITNDLEASNVPVGKAVASVDVVRDGDPVHIIKQFINDPAVPGGTVDLEFTLINYSRFDDATNVTFTDDLDAALSGLVAVAPFPTDPCGAGSSITGTSVLTLNNGTIPSNGGSCSFIITCQVPAGALPGSYLNTTSNVTCDQGTGNDASNPLQVSALGITKVFLDNPVGPGESTVLEFTITNYDPMSSATDISFEDVFATVLPTASVLPPSEGCGAGSTVAFTPLFNPSPPCNPCDGIPGRLTLTGGNLAPAGMPGSSCTFTITLDVAADAAGGIYPNATSNIEGTIGMSTIIGPQATDDLEILTAPNFSKEFSGVGVPGGTVDLTFTIDYPADASGDLNNITFTDDLATMGIAGIAASLPPSPDPPCGAGSTLVGSAGDSFLTLMGGNLTPGSSCSFTVTLNIPAAAAANTYTNTTSDISGEVNGSPITGFPAQADLLVSGLTFTKEFINDPVLPGETVTLRFTIDNTLSMDDATTISFIDALANVLPGSPDLSIATVLPIEPCGVGNGTLSNSGSNLFFVSGSVTAGGFCTFDIQLNVPAGAPDGTFGNTTSNLQATVNGSSITLPPAVDPLVINSVLLDISKEFTDDPVFPGDPVTLQFTITNLDATRTITNINFTDDLGAGLPGLVATGLPFAACGGTVDAIPDAGTIDFSGGTLAPGANCSFSVTLNVPASANSSNFTNTTSTIAGVSSGIPVTGNSAQDNLLIRTLSLTKAFAGPADAAGTVDLTFTLNNLDAANGVGPIKFNDDLDAMIPGATIVSMPATDICGAGSSISGTSTLFFENGVLSPSGNCSFTITVSIPCTTASNTYTNTTSVVTVNGLTVSPPAIADLVVTADMVPPDITCPADPMPIEWIAGFNLNPVMANMPQDPSIDPSVYVMATATDNCGPPVAITYQDVLIGPDPMNCPNLWVVERTWTATDVNGLTSTCVQTFTFTDTTPPSITCQPDPMPIEWTPTFNTNPVMDNMPQDPSIDPTIFGVPTASDNCGTPTVTYQDVLIGPDPMNCPNLWVVERTWTAKDVCGLTSTCVQTFTFTDTTPPMLSPCPPDPMPIEWPAGFNTTPVMANMPQDPSVDPAVYGMPTATDNCGTPTISYQDVLIGPNPANCPNLWTLERTWTATDACGLTSTCVQTFTFTDTTPPDIVCPPDPDPIEWPIGFNVTSVPPNTPQDFRIDPALTGVPTASDNCGFAGVPINCTTIDGPVTNLNYDALGLISTSFSINGVSPIPATATCVTEVCITVHMIADIGGVGFEQSNIRDEGGNVIGQNGNSNGDCNLDGAYSTMCIPVAAYNTYAADGTLDFSIDTDGDIDNICATQTIQASIEICSDCGPAEPTYQDVITGPFPNDCATGLWIVERTWTVRDACGAEASCVQTFSFIDTTPPVINTCPPDPAPIEWPVGFNTTPVGPNTPQDPSIDPSNYPNIVYSDNCGVQSVGYQDVLIGPDPMNCPNLWVVERTWTVTDFCDLSVTCVQTFTFTDTTPPTITNCPGSPGPIEWPAVFNTTPVMANTPQDPSIAPAIYGNVVATDNCGTPTVSYQDVIVGPTPANCPNLWEVTRTWTVTDACGLTSTCVQTFTFTDTTPPTITTCPPTRNVEGCGTADIMNGGLTNLAYSPTGTTVMEGDFTGEGGAANDNCGIETYHYQDVASGTCPIVITRTWTITDYCGLTVVCTQVINIDDTTPPTVACLDIPSINLDPTGNLTITPTQVFDAAGSSDNCGVALNLISVSPSAFSCLDEGSNTVTLTAEDDCGNENTCTATVFIEDFITNIVANTTPESCAGAGDGQIFVSATAGGGQIQYSIDGGNSFQFNSNFFNLTPGTYNIVIKVFGIPAICEVTLTLDVDPGAALTVWYKDLDNDGYSDGVTQTACVQPTGYKASGDLAGPEIDCDDNDPLKFPGQVWYPDADGDGYGSTPSITQCQRPLNYKAASELTEPDTDCNDTNAAINPGATEICNGIDDNCNMSVDEGLSGETYVGNVFFSTQAQIDAWPPCFSIIDGSVTIQGLGVNNLGALANIEEITGNLLIQSTGLTNMSGLGALTEVGGSVTIFFNGSLTSLNGLGALATVGGNLSVYYNFALSNCCAILGLINGPGVTGAIVIFFNTNGCNSVPNINVSCPGPNPISGPNPNAINAEAPCSDCVPPTVGSVVAVFPNPTSSKLNVLFSGAVEKGTMEMTDAIGRKVYVHKITENNNIHQLDVSNYSKGLYLLTIKIDGLDPVVKRVLVD